MSEKEKGKGKDNDEIDLDDLEKVTGGASLSYSLLSTSIGTIQLSPSTNLKDLGGASMTTSMCPW